MTMQKRPLSGMVQATGEAKPIAVSNVAPTNIHTEDASSTQLAGPFADEVTLYANNPTGASIDLTVTINGMATLVAVASKTTMQVLDAVPFRSADNTAASVITGQGSAAGVLVWGYFGRPL